jgi:DNA (cytosine-5)-methyltransferase 1
MAERKVVDINLFAGAGGLALGLSQAGFEPSVLYEVDQAAQDTLRRNQLLCYQPRDWARHCGDVTKVKWEELESSVRLLAGGVPCQPFSNAGSHMAQNDERNHFPSLLRAVRKVRPQIIIVENVQGLLRGGFARYFGYVLRALRNISLAPRKDDSWINHDARLKRHESGNGTECDYTIQHALLNAADYGVPQVRHRVFVVALAAGLPTFNFPPPTHSRTALIHALRERAYWERHGIRKPSGLEKRLGVIPDEDGCSPWVTVRDALSDLPLPASSEAAAQLPGAIANHWRIPGARSYSGHTGSDRDWPSKTIKAGVHGVPGGENTLRLGPSRIRYMTLREAATLQSFPMTHYFAGSRAQITRQIGNAVPPLLAKAVAEQIYSVATPISRRTRR